MKGLVRVYGRELDVKQIVTLPGGVVFVDENPPEIRPADRPEWERIRTNLRAVAGRSRSDDGRSDGMRGTD